MFLRAGMLVILVDRVTCVDSGGNLQFLVELVQNYLKSGLYCDGFRLRCGGTYAAE
jgi:hypothetical protein